MTKMIEVRFSIRITFKWLIYRFFLIFGPFIHLDTHFCVHVCVFAHFTLFFWHAFQERITLLRLLFMNSSCNIWLFSISVGPMHCSRDLQISLYSNFFIKNESQNTIYTFKNYFTIMFSIFSFQFSISTK